MTLPTPGLCWSPDNLEKAIGFSAKVDKKQSHYFLACHSPVERIHDDRLKKELSEEELYERIMGRHRSVTFSACCMGRRARGSPTSSTG